MSGENWFKHDIDSRLVPAMGAFILRHGAQGYGVFWLVVEEMYRCSKLKQTKQNLANLANAWQMDFATFATIIDYAVECGLWYWEGDLLGSKKVEEERLRRDEKRSNLSKIRAEAGRRGGTAKASKAKQKVANVPRLDKSRLDNIQRTINSSLEAHKKNPDRVAFAPRILMTDVEYQNIVSEFGEDSVKYHLPICSDWLVSNGQTKKSPVAFVRNWIRREIAECRGYYFTKRTARTNATNFDKNMQERNRLLKLEQEGKL